MKAESSCRIHKSPELVPTTRQATPVGATQPYVDIEPGLGGVTRSPSRRGHSLSYRDSRGERLDTVSLSAPFSQYISLLAESNTDTGRRLCILENPVVISRRSSVVLQFTPTPPEPNPSQPETLRGRSVSSSPFGIMSRRAEGVRRVQGDVHTRTCQYPRGR
jgi:hypothetical protein